MKFLNRTADGRITWGDEHVQKSSVVNITHVEAVGDGDVVMRFWQLVVLVGLATGELGSIVALLVMR